MNRDLERRLRKLERTSTSGMVTLRHEVTGEVTHAPAIDVIVLFLDRMRARDESDPEQAIYEAKLASNPVWLAASEAEQVGDDEGELWQAVIREAHEWRAGRQSASVTSTE